MHLASQDPRAALMVNDAALILKRYYLLVRAGVLLQAAWLPGTATLDLKLALAEFLWQDALVAKELRQRVLELRFPERLIVPEADAPLLAWWRAFGDAPSGEAFVAGLALVLKPALRQAFSAYLDLADPLDDAPTRRILRQALADLDEQQTRWQGLLEQSSALAQPATAAWLAAARQALAAAGPGVLLGPPAERLPALGATWPLQVARLAARDPRYPRLAFAWPDRIEARRGPGEGLALQVRAAVHHANEIWATEMAAAVLADLAEQAPPEFLDDAARWCFDESRHCRMGLARLRAFGFPPELIPFDSFSYDAGAALDAVTRLGIIFYFETTFIHTKPQRAKIFAEAGDRLSSHDMDFDWADEQIHTHYGSQWLKHFLAQAGDTLSPLQVREAAEAAVRRLQAAATPGDEAATQAMAEQMLAWAHQRAAGVST
jgi:uncharacterized ferritin-like protein (DUF455 family)